MFPNYRNIMFEMSRCCLSDFLSNVRSMTSCFHLYDIHFHNSTIGDDCFKLMILMAALGFEGIME